MLAVVTGGTGFVGQKLVARLIERGDTVRVISRRSHSIIGKGNSPRYIQCDLSIANTSELSAYIDGADILFHCAGQLRNVSDMRALHVDGTRRLASAAQGHIKRWVQLSSVGVYGPVGRGMISESSVFNPQGEYERTKAEAERIVVEAAERGGFEFSTLRPSNIYAPSMTNQSLYALINMISKGVFFYIGKSGAVANYIHVNNVIDGLLLCASHDQARGHAFNISDTCNLEQFVDIISKNLGVASPRLRLSETLVRFIVGAFGWVPNVPLTASRVNALTTRAVYSTEKIETLLGYNPSVSMEAGLRDFVEHYLRVRSER